MSSAPLSGLTVVDLTELLPGPFLTQNLVDLGARVIKVERPGGDNARHLDPAMFAAVNRGKEMVTADLKTQEGRDALHALLADADVLVEGFRPGVMARLGFADDAVRARYPRLVYASLSGYGQDGPLAAEPGHDINYIAYSGVLALSGVPGGPPQWGAGVPVADLCASMYAMSAVLAALNARSRTGTGSRVDISIRDCLTHWLNPRISAFHGAGTATVPEQRAVALRRAGYGVFECSDGAFVTIAAIEDRFFGSLARTLDLPGRDDPRWETYRGRNAAAGRINESIAHAVAGRPAAEVVAALSAAGVPVAPVLSPEAAVAGLAATRAGSVLDTSDAGPTVLFPVRFH